MYDSRATAFQKVFLPQHRWILSVAYLLCLDHGTSLLQLKVPPLPALQATCQYRRNRRLRIHHLVLHMLQRYQGPSLTMA